MKYIVWRTPYKSYDYAQGDGYFVKWKNKCSDEFSPNWFDANKYKTIGPAITRLGIEINDHIKSLDDFFKVNSLSESIKRQNVILEILEEGQNSDIFFLKGHIDKIDDNGNLIGNAGDEVLEYIKNIIQKNIGKSKFLQKKFEGLGVSNYIDNSISDEEFYK
jgi:hypothetical protein